MSDHHPHQHHHQQHHQFGFSDLRQLISAGRTHFQCNPQPTNDSFFLHHQTRNLVPSTQLPPHITHHFNHNSILSSAPAAAANASQEVIFPSAFVKYSHDPYNTNITLNNATTAASSAAGNIYFNVDLESGWIGNDYGNNSSRWPRQETLTLLDIRSRLDSRFKEANQKGPLWDEVSRIMAEEHGYQRSGKKCREKFENLYKYYKKTKEGKAGRQDGKHYRFFRQLEALYGETSNNQLASETTNLVNGTANSTFLYQTPAVTMNQESFQETYNKHSDQSLSFSNTSEFETSSSENNNDDDLSAIAYNTMKQKGTESQSYTKDKKKNWKGKVKEFVHVQTKKMMETQEIWMEKMLKTIEDREQERMFREEEWTKKETARLNKIHELWAKEKAWIESRDVALMEVLRKCSKGKGLELSSSIDQIALATENHYKNQDQNAKMAMIDTNWSEPEVFSLMQIRTTMESRFQESSCSSSSGYGEEGLWEEIAGKMASLGYERGADECKEKWENMNDIYFKMAAEREGNKKRKDELKNLNYFQQFEAMNTSSSSPTSNSYVGSQMHVISCFDQVPINNEEQGEQLWNKYGMTPMSKEKNQQL